jgi:hypothetical protein
MEPGWSLSSNNIMHSEVMLSVIILCTLKSCYVVRQNNPYECQMPSKDIYKMRWQMNRMIYDVSPISIGLISCVDYLHKTTYHLYQLA